jgi:26S proteasome regulatory subunit N9
MDDDVVAALLSDHKEKYPQYGEEIDTIVKYNTNKLYHQLTLVLLGYIRHPEFDSGDDLVSFFNGFLKHLQDRVKPINWVLMLSIVAKQMPAQDALTFIEPEAFPNQKDANNLWKVLKAEKLVSVGEQAQAKKILEPLGKQIDAAYEVNPLVASAFHKAYAQLYKATGEVDLFYRSSMDYLAYTPLEQIPEGDKTRLAFDISVSALLAKKEFNFGELLLQDIVKTLRTTQFSWVVDILQAFSDGNLSLFDQSMQKHQAEIAASELSVEVLAAKIRQLALMELAFKKLEVPNQGFQNPANRMPLDFDEISQHCRVPQEEVEFLAMRAMANGLIKGKINQVQEVVHISWLKPRILDNQRIRLMRDRIDLWAQRAAGLANELEEMTPELLVS